MRAFIRGSLFIMAGLLSGCSHDRAKSATPTAASAEKTLDGKAAVMWSGRTEVLKVNAPPDIKSVAGDGTLHFKAAHYEVEFWLARDAKTVDEAVAKVATQIKDEFTDFKPDHATDLTVAGAPAKRLVGAGHEADDGDAGQADVIVFKVAGHVFVACNHGESLDARGQGGLLMLVQAAQKP